MNYESIILELLSRIKTLEEKVSALEKYADELKSSADSQTADLSDTKKSVSYQKMTKEMIDICYHYGKKAYESDEESPWHFADLISHKTGMNRSSAFMYICAVKCMLEGSIFKRAINAKALSIYLGSIHEDYGKTGLDKALNSLKEHIEYRKQFNQPTNSLTKVYDEYNDRLTQR